MHDGIIRERFHEKQIAFYFKYFYDKVLGVICAKYYFSWFCTTVFINLIFDLFVFVLLIAKFIFA